MSTQLAIHITDAVNVMRRLGSEALFPTRDRIMEMIRSPDPLTKQIGRFAVIGMGVTLEAVESIEEATEPPQAKEKG